MNNQTIRAKKKSLPEFPLIWETLHGKGSCLWASEIEEFPIAVTRLHFPEQ